MTDRTRYRGRRGTYRYVGIALLLPFTACTGSGTNSTGSSAEERRPEVGPTAPRPGEDTLPPSDELDAARGRLYLVDPATGEVERVRSSANDVREPEASPDGSRVAYQGTSPDGTQQIYVLEDDTSRQLTHLPGGALEPTWSPDGSRIAFVGHVRQGDDMDILVVDLAGGSVRRLSGTEGEDRRPDWSPDGSAIVFDTGGSILMAPLEGGTPSVLDLRPITLDHGPPGDPRWSPDGRWIAFIRYSPGTLNNHVRYAAPWLIRSDGGKEQPLYRWRRGRQPNGTCWLRPTWSPDGKAIALINGSPSRGIAILSMRNGNISRLPMRERIAGLHWATEGIVVSTGVDALPHLTWAVDAACP